MKHRQQGTGTKIVKNAVFGILRVVIAAPIPIIMTPFILHRIGVAGFGIWTLWLSLISITSLADLGLIGTLSKHVAEFHARSESERLKRILSTGTIIFILLGIGVPALVKLSSSLWLPVLLRGPFHPTDETNANVTIVCLIICSNLLVFPFSSVLSGLQRMDITNSLAVASQVLSACLMAAALVVGSGVNGLLYATLMASVCTLIVNVIVARRLLDECRIDIRHFDIQEVTELFNFSFKVYLTQVAVVVHNNMEKLLLAHFAGLVPVSWYQIGSDLALKIRLVPSLVLSPILPAASELSARDDSNRLLELYYRANKYLALLSLPIAVLVVQMSRRFVQVWLGPGYQPVVLSLSILTVVQFVNLATGPGYLIMVGMGDLKPGIKSASLGLATNLVLSTIFIGIYGFPGAIFGTSISLILASAYFLYLFHGATRYSWRTLVEPYAKPIIAALGSAIVLSFLLPRFPVNKLTVVAACVSFGVMYSCAVLILRCIDEFDLNAIAKVVPVPKSIRKLVLFA